jgi:hypothetical protein
VVRCGFGLEERNNLAKEEARMEKGVAPINWTPVSPRNIEW